MSSVGVRLRVRMRNRHKKTMCKLQKTDGFEIQPYLPTHTHSPAPAPAPAGLSVYSSSSCRCATRGVWAMPARSKQDPHRLLHCQWICLPSVNSHLKKETEAESDREKRDRERERACLRCCNYANSPYTVKRLANKDFSWKTATAAATTTASGKRQAASGIPK